MRRISTVALLALTFGAMSGVALAAEQPGPTVPAQRQVPAALHGGALTGVAAASPSDIWAVGVKGDDTLIRHWDGSAWTLVPSPNVDGASNKLAAVAVVGPDDVWAVGQSRTADGGQVLIEHWDEATWSIAEGINPGPENFLTAVSGTGPNDVWAVGGFVKSEPSGGLYSMAIHWDGHRWGRSSLYKRP